MNIQESINRGFNLLATTIVGLTGFAFLPEVFLENDMPDKVDDGLLFALALVGMWWYNKSRNRFTRSVLPFALVALALIVKIGGLIVEFDDANAAGDDFGGLILLVLATGLVWYQYQKSAKLLSASAS